MLGYALTFADGEVQRISSDRYAVTESASIVFFDGDSEIKRVDPGDWIEVNSIGTRLSDQWPSPKLGLVIDAVAHRLAVHYGHFVHDLRDLDRFEDWRLNELEALTTAVFVAIGDDDPYSSEHRAERCDVSELIARGFGVTK